MSRLRSGIAPHISISAHPMAEEGADDFLREIDELLGDEGGGEGEEGESGGGEGGTESAPVLEKTKTA